MQKIFLRRPYNQIAHALRLKISASSPIWKEIFRSVLSNDINSFRLSDSVRKKVNIEYLLAHQTRITKIEFEDRRKTGFIYYRCQTLRSTI